MGDGGQCVAERPKLAGTLRVRWAPRNLERRKEGIFTCRIRTFKDKERNAGKTDRNLLLEFAVPKILLVEDNEDNRDMLARRLQRKGYTVVLAVDGRQGVELATSAQPDLILMDMSLPVLDGWEATRLLKASPETSAVPVIALTAHAMSGDRERAIAAGCDDYDIKPIELPRLLDKIAALLRRASAPEAK